MPLQSSGNPIGRPFIELQSIDSTNKYAMGLVHREHLTEGQGEAQHGTAIFSHEQTAGRGQRGKSWASEKGSNIALSILLNPSPLKVQQQFQINVYVAISVCEFFSKYAGTETRIKWPNDIYWRDRKAGGVLIENVIGSQTPDVRRPDTALRIQKSEWKWAVAGIGININQTQFPVELANPVSLKQITGKDVDPLELAKELCEVLEKNFQLLMKGDFEKLFDTYQTYLYKKDERVKLKKGTRVFETIIKGVSKAGQLITQHAIEESFEFGEIEWIL